MKYLVIDSKKRINGTSTEFNYKISQEIKICKKIKLAYCSIPNTSYLINSSNNIFRIKFASDPSYINYNIPYGTYLPQELGDVITNLINKLSYVLSYNNYNLKFNMTASESFNIDWSVSGNLNQILGYDLTQNTGINITGNNIIKYVYPEILYINISNLSTNNIITSDNIGYNFVVPITASFGVLNFYMDDSVFDNEAHQTFNSMIIKDNFKVTIFDEYGKIYNNNNVDTIMIFEIN